jgi:probable HAF family extracellular repeat protein
MATRALLLVGLLVSSAVPAAAVSDPTFEIIARDCFAGAVAVSADGSSVLSYHYGGCGGPIYPVVNRWRAGTNTLVTGAGESLSFGGLSGDGSVVAGGLTPGGQTTHRAYRWQDGPVEYLGSGTDRARDISGDASTIVGRGTSGGSSQAYRHQGGIVTYLGDLPGGTVSSEAWAVNGDGTVIVGRGNSATGDEAFRWQNGSMQGLGDLDGGAFASEAHDVSPDGSIVVGWGSSASGTEAFRWQNDVMTGLGLLDGSYATHAYGVAADGTLIVGEAITNPSDFYDGKVAVIWDAQGIHRLEDWLLQKFGLDLNGYDLRSALGVSSDGRTIVGEGVDLNAVSGSDRRIAWVITIPEPTTATMMVVGLLSLAAARRRHGSNAIRSPSA